MKMIAILLACLPLSTFAGTQLVKDEKTSLKMRGYARMGLEFGDSRPELKNYSTRVGFEFRRVINPFLDIDSQIEWAVNPLGSDSYEDAEGDNRITLNSDGSTFLSNRLGNVAFITPFGEIRVGKQWSLYAEVAEWADLFTNSSGDVTGIYSFKSDGGFLGTGRADKAFIYRKEFERIKFGLQYQAMGGQEIASVGNHNNGYGANLIFKVLKGLEIGFAYNEVDIDLTNGVDRTPKSMAASIRYKVGKVKFAFSYADLKDSESSSGTLDANTLYNKANGLESYFGYEFIPTYFAEIGHGFFEQENVGNQTKKNYFLLSVKQSHKAYEYGIMGKIDSSKNATGQDVDDNYVSSFFKYIF